ncbi:MAG: hypothetical protein KC800_30225 [Candidatus Eremiobacteraeota bacterium]|nr:hypothetical protein [Candidatus Eremiobacteraeota bacterium]
MRCQICKSFTPYEETGLVEMEEELTKLDQFRSYGSGWTRYISEHWACSDCLDQGRALPGDPSVQDCRGNGPKFFACHRSDDFGGRGFAETLNSLGKVG